MRRGRPLRLIQYYKRVGRRTRQYCQRVGRRKLIFTCLFILVILRWILLPLAIEIIVHCIYIFIMQSCENGDNMWRHMSFQYIDGNKEATINCIPSVPSKESPISWHVPSLNRRLSENYLKIKRNETYNSFVLILSPLSNSEKHLPQFSKLLSTLSYPHHLISVYFGEEGSTDKTVTMAKNITNWLVKKHGFRDARLVQLATDDIYKNNRKMRHFPSFQKARRIHLAKARNLLTKQSLTDQTWILWIDCDIIQFRSDVIEQFIFSDQDVMAASALVSKVELGYFKMYGVYDRNIRRIATDKHGTKQYSIYLNDLKAEGREAKVDFVGACMLMIRANCVRNGLVFPEIPYEPNGPMVNFEGLESEGLGQLANNMGYRVYGLPFLEIEHAYETLKHESIFLQITHSLYSLVF